MDGDSRRARQLVQDTAHMTLATADASGKPWSCPVYFAHDQAFALYWVSFRQTVHSANIRVRPQVGVSILGEPPGHEGQGVYFDALAAELHDNPADAGALVAMITAAATNCELAGLAGQIRAWLADNGYASAASFKELDHLMLLVAVRREAAQAGRASAAGALPEGWEKMAARLATPAGKSLYKRRAALVEPAFAQFFARFGRQVNYRGRDAVDTEIKLLATVHNLGKLLDHRRRHPAPAT